MTIKLQALLKAANFPSEEVDKLLADEQYLTKEEKFELASDAWFILSQRYFSALELEKSIILKEIEQGKRKYNPNDFEEVKARLLHEFAQKLEAAESQTAIEEVRKKLEEFKLSQPSQRASPSFTPNPTSESAQNQ